MSKFNLLTKKGIGGGSPYSEPLSEIAYQLKRIADAKELSLMTRAEREEFLKG